MAEAPTSLITLTVETGAGVPGANSYASELYASAYHEYNGTIASWLNLVAASATVGMLIAATRQIERSYRWSGTILTVDQGLGLPREDLTLEDGRVLDGAAQVLLAADAVAWLALRLYNDQSTKGKRVKIEETLPDYRVRYADGGLPTHGEVDTMLAGLYDSGGLGKTIRNVKLVRWS